MWGSLELISCISLASALHRASSQPECGSLYPAESWDVSPPPRVPTPYLGRKKLADLRLSMYASSATVPLFAYPLWPFRGPGVRNPSRPPNKRESRTRAEVLLFN